MADAKVPPTVPPITPQVVPPEAKNDDVQPLDPFIQNLIKKTELVLPPKAVEDAEVESPRITLGDIAELEKKKPATTPPVVEEEDPPAEQPPVVPPVVPPEAKKPNVVPKREPAPVQQPPAPVVPPVPEKKEPTAEEKAAADLAAYEATLSEDQREELNLARYAEAHGKKGVVDQIVKRYKAVDAFMVNNPDADPEGEEFTKVLTDNPVEWTPAEQRRFERAMIKDEVKKESVEEVKKALEPQERELREMKMAPVIKAALVDVEAALVNADPEVKEATPFDKDVLAAIKEKGYAEAAKQFTLEAPIVQGAINAAESWMKMCAGTEVFDPRNKTHDYIAKFLAQEGENMLRMPKEVQMRDGRQFVPMGEYLKLVGENSPRLNQVWTFADNEVPSMIADHAKLVYGERIGQLEASGWKREAKKPLSTSSSIPPIVPPSTTTTPPPVTPENASPRARGRMNPGADDGVVPPAPPTEVDKFMSKLVPTYKKPVGK